MSYRSTSSPCPVEGQHARVLRAVRIVHDRADRRRDPDCRDRRAAWRPRLPGPRGPRDRALPRPRRRGRRRDPCPRLRCASMLRCATSEVLLDGGHGGGNANVDLDDGDRHGGPVDDRRGQQHGRQDRQRGRRREDDPVRSPPLPRHQAGDRRVHEHDDEGDAPDGGDARQRQQRPVRHLDDAERDPGEPAERPRPADPIQDGPRRRDRERVDDRAVRAGGRARRRPRTPRSPRPTGGRARSRRASRTADPVQGRPVQPEPEAQTDERAAPRRTRPQDQQQRNEADEGERPRADRRERQRCAQARAAAPRRTRRAATGARGRSHHAQSRQSIFFLSASWLRCFTR